MVTGITNERTDRTQEVVNEMVAGMVYTVHAPANSMQTIYDLLKNQQEQNMAAVVEEVRLKGYVTNESVTAVSPAVFQDICRELTINDSYKAVELRWDGKDNGNPVVKLGAVMKPFTFMSLDDSRDMFEIDYREEIRDGNALYVKCSIMLSRRKQRQA